MYSHPPSFIVFKTTDDQKTIKQLCPNVSLSQDELCLPFSAEEVSSFLMMLDELFIPHGSPLKDQQVHPTLKNLNDAARVAQYLKMQGEQTRHPAYWHNHFRDTLMRPLILSLEGLNLPFGQTQHGHNEQLNKMWELEPTETDFKKWKDFVANEYKKDEEVDQSKIILQHVFECLGSFCEMDGEATSALQLKNFQLQLESKDQLLDDRDNHIFPLI
jgi:hypothetical protein